ncbi:Rapid ALkalinization Factor protein [Dioscorea alata]|uniref:Rapid ALkalinization Factor protein n=1 Tax=Dioscorea alata TaxID=55571 RepID=A0ACB7VQ77_DIOAL|nr:Rapid ALkalinization Factor protein [Dioscorea alata]
MAIQRRSISHDHHLLLLLLLLLTISIQTLAMSSHKPKAQNLEWITSKPNHNYKGAIEDYLEGEELELGSELSRRILATAGTISYGALRRDTTPCSRRGASYYNCRAGAQANPYSRGCSAITQCRS